MTTTPIPVGRTPEGGSFPARPDAAGEGPGTCSACGRPLAAGEALAVTVRDGGAGYYVHRPEVGPDCIGLAGPACTTSIALADPAAARRRDRAAGGRDPVRHQLSETLRQARRAAEETRS